MKNLDSAANVFPSDEVITDYCRDVKVLANPHSNHVLSLSAHSKLKESTDFLKNEIFGRRFQHVHFSQSGSTANQNILLNHIPMTPAQINGGYRDTIICSSIEHSSIDQSVCKILISRGYTVIKTPMSANGMLDLEAFLKILKAHSKHIAIVSVMYANNETGILQPIEEMTKIARQHSPDALVHTDVAQGLLQYMKNPVPVDAVTFSMYKLHGLMMGIALSTRPPVIDIYAGTPDVAKISANVSQILRFLKDEEKSIPRLEHLKSVLFRSLEEKLPVPFKAFRDNTLPRFCSLLLPVYIQSSVVQRKLSEMGFCVSPGSACLSEQKRGSHVIKAVGYSETHSSLRITLSDEILEDDLMHFSDALSSILNHLKILSHENNVSISDPNPPPAEYCRPIRHEAECEKNLDGLNLAHTKCNRVCVGESYLRGKNKSKYIDMLMTQLHEKCHEKPHRISDYVFLMKDSPIDVLKEIPGISQIYVGECIQQPANISYLMKYVAKSITDAKTFRVTVKSKHHAVQMQRALGKNVEECRPDMKVNLTSPDVTFYVFIDKHWVMVSTHAVKGRGGFPMGSEGKGLCIGEVSNESGECMKCRGLNMVPCESGDDITSQKCDVIIWDGLSLHDLWKIEKKHSVPVFAPKTPPRVNNILVLMSGGIDSPVACAEALKLGIKTHLIHFTDNPERIDNILELTTKLSNEDLTGLTVVKFDRLQDYIVLQCPESYRTVMYKVYMIKIANLVAEMMNCDAICTGDSWAQVASQAPRNLKNIRRFSVLPIWCPLIHMNKDQIIAKADEIGTFRQACTTASDCCVMYMPKNPVIKSKFKIIKNLVENIGLPMSLVDISHIPFRPNA